MADIEEGRRRSSAAAAFSSAPGTPWEHPQSDYTQSHHSHHGTPAQEFSGFDFGIASQSPMDSSQGPRPMLQPLVMPAHTIPHYPSMLKAQTHSMMHSYASPMPNGQAHPMVHSLSSPLLNSHAHYTAYHQPIYHQPVQPIQSVPVPMGPLQTPVSASSSKSLTTPRKTLSNADRRRMCQYSDDHPGAKQVEIGSIFGVERSTVSKVLRQRDKYLQQDEGSRSPHKRVRGKLPDIEKTLANWAKNQEKKGMKLTDELLRERIHAFSATASPDLQQTLNSSWIEKFKLKHNLMGARSRKSSLALEDADLFPERTAAKSTNGSSPISTAPRDSPPETNLRSGGSRRESSAESHESITDDSPESFMGFPGNPLPFHSQSMNSSASAYTDGPPHSSFSPGPLSPISPFFTPDSGTAPSPFIPQPPLTARTVLPAPASSNSHRPRSQTFPSLDQYIVTTGEDSTPRYLEDSVLDSPMHEPPDPLLSLSETLHVADNDDDELERSLGSFDPSCTVSPGDTMGPPPLPNHVLAAASVGNSLRTSQHAPPPSLFPASFAELMVTSTDEARAALELVIGFFAQQPKNPLNRQETVTLAKLVEKLKLQSKETS